jgi:hypothetical protein
MSLKGLPAAAVGLFTFIGLHLPLDMEVFAFADVSGHDFGKLFFVDLAALSALGRIALFLGFGAVFLVISYLLPRLTMGASRQPEAKEQEGDLPSGR